jgi:voltage-gated potassium channel
MIEPSPSPSAITLLGRTLRGERSARLALRARVHQVIEVGRGDDRASRLVDTVIITLICLNIAAFVAGTVPWIAVIYGRWLDAFEAFSVAVFTIEYAARIWTAPEVPFLARRPAVAARLAYARRPALLIDLAAILPFYLGALLPLDLRVLRVLRLLRFLKLSRYSPAMHTLIRVLTAEKNALAGALLLLVGAVLIASTGMYYLESEAQPDKLGSIPEAAYWAITTLTTVGYGDVSPVTPWGKVWAGLTMVVGLCILALPVAIIATGFAQEATRRDFVVTWSLMSRIPLLADLDTTDVAALMPLLHANTVPPAAEIIAGGKPGDGIYFIAAGAVELHAGDRRVRYTTGEFFGAVATLDDDVSPGSFRAIGRTRLLKLHREDFNRLEHINPRVGAHIRRIAAEQRRDRERLGTTPSSGSIET